MCIARSYSPDASNSVLALIALLASMASLMALAFVVSGKVSADLVSSGHQAFWALVYSEDLGPREVGRSNTVRNSRPRSDSIPRASDRWHLENLVHTKYYQLCTVSYTRPSCDNRADRSFWCQWMT